MFTLSTVTSETKTILKWGGIGIAVIFVLFLVIRMISAYIQSAQPPPPPDQAFGKLPVIALLQAPSQQNFAYTLNTLSGQLPATSDKPNSSQFPDRLPVYKIVQPTTNILALQNAVKAVAADKFTSPPTQLSETQYQWTGQDNEVNSTLVLNILTYNFQLTSLYASDNVVKVGLNISTPANAIAAAQTFLTPLGLFPLDLDTAKTKTALFSLQNGQLIPATSLSNTQIIRVDFFQKDLSYSGYANPLSIYYQTGSQTSPMNFLVGGGQYNAQVVQGNWFHQTIDTTTVATYPIKSAQQAFNELKSGVGFIASAPTATQNVNITGVALGYFIGNDAQSYLMPIFVFQGDNGFLAYVSAISEKALQN